MNKRTTTKVAPRLVPITSLHQVIGGASSIYLDPTKSVGGLPPPPPPPSTNG